MLPKFIQDEHDQLIDNNGQLGAFKPGVTRDQVKRYFERASVVKSFPVESLDAYLELKELGYKVIKHTSNIIILGLGDSEYEFTNKRIKDLIMIIFDLGHFKRNY